MYSTKQLPPRSDFYSTIQEKTISREDHLFAESVWKKFRISNLTEYAKLYCEIDTLLLAEIFQKFRKTMLAFGGLDPAHYISLPGLGWDIMLKITGCIIELPADIDQVHFIERGIRGGLSFINTRYKCLKKKSEEKKPAIRYIDANASIYLNIKVCVIISNKLFY